MATAAEGLGVALDALGPEFDGLLAVTYPEAGIVGQRHAMTLGTLGWLVT